jgi:serine/threonine protein kinase
MSADSQRTCPSCGNELSGIGEFCPVCMLRIGLAGGVQSGESSISEDTVEATTPDERAQRFDHYELMMGGDGKPIELGRGAMGVTYKALDINLRRPVTLKVISERYLGDESARARFLREARAAASVRHPNVASVFHLGRTGGSYFYAMEFVEGETLAELIKRTGTLETKLALEIAAQVAGGLAAIHEQNLVHRDIKPTNIMVRLREEGSVTAKIIDLGLAKTVDESASEAGISSPGVFVGTADFASPEQFAGVGVDVRSDLYSLGVTLWKMVTGQTPFRGTPAEVMYQHQHAPLPLEGLEHVPRPVASLVDSLLDKNPARRPQSPSELHTLLLAVRAALDPKGELETHDVIRESAENWRGVRALASSWRLSAEPWYFKPFLTGKLKDFTGRQWLFEEIDKWRATASEQALLIIGEPGVGKSSIVAALVSKNPDGQVLAYHCCRADARLSPLVRVAMHSSTNRCLTG